MYFWFIWGKSAIEFAVGKYADKWVQVYVRLRPRKYIIVKPDYFFLQWNDHVRVWTRG